MNILVVDDDAVCRLAISQTLRQAGYEVVVACDGQEALNLLHENPIHLVVSDWSMPNLNGVELCRAVRSADLRHYVYFIMLTSHSQPQDTLDGLEAGADDFIVKPFNPSELVMRVNVGRRIIEMETRDLTIFAMAKLAESRDPETGTHLERIRGYSRVLAQWMLRHHRGGTKINEEYVRLLCETCPLHDIGKIAILDRILLKPGRLDDSEFETMKMHTVLGANMLDAALHEFPNAGFLQMARDIALSHHEHYDGRGYPQGLAGEAIPLCGRIVALADVYDALTTKRIYKKAYSHASATSIITDKSPGQFDPSVIEAFLAEENQFKAIRAEYAVEIVNVSFEKAAAAYALSHVKDQL